MAQCHEQKRAQGNKRQKKVGETDIREISWLASSETAGTCSYKHTQTHHKKRHTNTYSALSGTRTHTFYGSMRIESCQLSERTDHHLSPYLPLKSQERVSVQLVYSLILCLMAACPLFYPQQFLPVFVVPVDLSLCASDLKALHSLQLC